MDDYIKLIDNNVRFWMIRTKQGFFFDEFIRDEYVAIGWNNITESRLKGIVSKQQEKLLKEEIGNFYDEKRPGTALNKCRRFYNDVKKGDFVVIVGNKKVGIAEVGDYYEESEEVFTVEKEKNIHNEIEHYDHKRDKIICPYIKRRKIKLLNLLSEKDIVNPYLSVALSVNRHSLSDLSDYAEIILSNCYEVFVYQSKLTLTVRVGQDKDINAMALSGFIYASSKFLGGYDKVVTVKTALHSPGDILLQVQNYIPDIDTIEALMIYLSLLGCKFGSVEFNSILKLYKDWSNRKHNRKMQELDEKLKEAEIELKKAETDKIRVETELLKNEKKQMVDEQESDTKKGEKYLSMVAECSKELLVKPTKTKIINFDKERIEQNKK